MTTRRTTKKWTAKLEKHAEGKAALKELRGPAFTGDEVWIPVGLLKRELHTVLDKEYERQRGCRKPVGVLAAEKTQ